jgi:23S rRNA (uracil1939-C5)-methyltransferase
VAAVTIVELRTTGVAKGGDGVAREASGRVVFVEGALAHEVVTAELLEQKKAFARARVVDVIEPSPDRTTPPCPVLRAGCGGCDFQHATPPAQRAAKVTIVRDALERIGRVADVPPIDVVALPIEGYRTTVRGLVLDGRFALRRRHSHDAIALGSCLVLHPMLDELVRDARFGAATEVTLRGGARTGERLALVAPDARGVSVPADVRVVGGDDALGRDGSWFHEVVDGHTLRVSARSFFQARPDGAEALVAAVRAAAGPLDASTEVVDAYGGVGLFAATVAAPAGAPVVLVERSASSVGDAAVNLAGTDATIVRTTVERWRAGPADVVIADPARAGLGKDAAARLAATGASRFVLVSCDPASAARDAGLLTAHGYRLTAVTLVDVFGHTSHIELVTAYVR